MESCNYPKMLESAVTMLSHYMNGKGAHMIDEDKGKWTRRALCRSIRP
jgi:hypothetical protein